MIPKRLLDTVGLRSYGGGSRVQKLERLAATKVVTICKEFVWSQNLQKRKLSRITIFNKWSLMSICNMCHKKLSAAKFCRIFFCKSTICKKKHHQKWRWHYPMVTWWSLFQYLLMVRSGSRTNGIHPNNKIAWPYKSCFLNFSSFSNEYHAFMTGLKFENEKVRTFFFHLFQNTFNQVQIALNISGRYHFFGPSAIFFFFIGGRPGALNTLQKQKWLNL